MILVAFFVWIAQIFVYSFATRIRIWEAEMKGIRDTELMGSMVTADRELSQIGACSVLREQNEN